MLYLDKEQQLSTQYDPMPKFGIYTLRTGTTPGYGFTVLNSNMNVILGAGLDLQGEAYNLNGATAMQTDAQVAGSASQNMVSGSNNNGILGNTLARLPIAMPTFSSASFFGAHFTASEAASVNSPQAQVINYGTSIGEYGVRARTSMYVLNATIGLYGRTNLVPLDRFTLTNGTHLNTTGEAGNVTYGMISYNDRTRTLIVIRAANAGTTYRAHVWRNPNMSLNNRHSYRTGQLWKFITDAYGAVGGASYYYNDFAWAGASTVEGCNHMRVILGDNNRVGLFRMNPNSTTNFAYITLNSGSTSATLTTLSSLTGNNPSYGIDSGNRFGTQAQISWDQQWMATWCAYASYQAGINMVLWYIPDPAIYYTYTNTDANAGISIAPIGANRWVVGTNLNTDGSGPRLFTLEAESPRVTGRSATSGTVLANGGALGLLDPGTLYLPDAFSSTTNYFGVVPVESRDSTFFSSLGI